MRLPTLADEADYPSVFRAAIDSFGAEPAQILAHHDTDGLSSAALLARALTGAGRHVDIRIVGRGESPWSQEMRAELQQKSIGGLIVADLGVRSGVLRTGTPAVVLDHHVPQGTPEGAVVISGFGMSPTPTSSLLAYRCASALADLSRLVWLAALGIIGDVAEAYGFPEMAEARARHEAAVLRTAAALLNQPRRSSSGDARPALALLLKADDPREILSGEHPETALLIAARDEVRRELARVRRTAPQVAGPVALVCFASACQIHSLIAQMWSSRMKGRVVIAANSGFRPGWVHFAARSAHDLDLVQFLRERAPRGADAQYGGGHHRASGGALRVDQWNDFVRKLGFTRQMEAKQ